MRKVNDELRAQQKKSNDCALDRERISQKINDLELELVTASQSLRSNNKDKEELIVQHDIKKLEVRRLRDHLNTKADEVYSLENKKQQLKFSIEEKKKEIDAHRDVQRANLKCAEDARHKVVMELKDRQSKMDRLKVKYEAVRISKSGFGGNQSVSRRDPPWTTLHILIESSLERTTSRYCNTHATGNYFRIF